MQYGLYGMVALQNNYMLYVQRKQTSFFILSYPTVKKGHIDILLQYLTISDYFSFSTLKQLFKYYDMFYICLPLIPLLIFLL